MSASNVATVVTFLYNGQPRKVKVDRARAGYIQGVNLHENAKTPAATYSINKMSIVNIIEGGTDWIRSMLGLQA